MINKKRVVVVQPGAGFIRLRYCYYKNGLLGSYSWLTNSKSCNEFYC